MRARGSDRENTAEKRYDVIETIRRAFREFLAVPTLMIVGFRALNQMRPVEVVDEEEELSALATALTESGRLETAPAVRTAQDTLARSVGKVNPRATRLEPDKAGA